MMKAVWPLMVVISILSLLSNSCIISYGEFPRIEGSGQFVSRKAFPIHYSVDPERYYLEAHVSGISPSEGFPTELPLMSQRHYSELAKAFADNRIFANAIPTTLPPEKGIYCAVSVRHKSISETAMKFTLLSYASLGLLPSYSGTSGDIVRFDLYVDNKLKKIYRYQMTQDRWMWLGLLPFVWVNFFTSGIDEAFRAMVQQFFLDAEKDGYF